MRHGIAFTIGVLAATGLSRSARADDADPAAPLVFSTEHPADTATPDADEGAAEEEAYGLSAGVGFASAYVWRGLNLLQAESQHDQHAVVQPSVAYDIPSTGLTLSYFSSYQVAGANRAELVDVGMGDEQDLALGWSHAIGDFSFGSALTAYAYPFADAEAAGTAVPVYLEPQLSVGASTVVDVGFATSLFAGLQDAIRPYSYVYLNPTVGRSFELSEIVSLDLASGYGFKAQRMSDNTHDVAVDASVTVAATSHLDVAPGVHWAWTNIADVGFAEEQVLWGSVDVEVHL